MKLAFIGTGKIIADALFAIEPIKEIEKTAIFARPHSKEKAEAFAKQYNIAEVYTDYEKLLTETAADTVYIGLINSAHYSYAKQALLHGKNVILEKPFTGFYNEAQELQQIAEENKLFIFEAVTVLHNEVFYEMKKNVEKLGTLRMALCNYSQYSSRYDAYLEGDITHSFDPAYYGGAGTLVLVYDGFSAVCTGSKDSDSPGYVSIQGEKGFMKIDSKPNIASELTTTYVDENVKERVRDAAGAMVRATITDYFTAKEQHHRMTQEFLDFAKIIDEKDYETAHELLTESVTVVGVLEKARSKAGIKF